MYNCSRDLADATSQKVAIHSYVINLQKLPIAVCAHLLMDFKRPINCIYNRNRGCGECNPLGDSYRLLHYSKNLLQWILYQHMDRIFVFLEVARRMAISIIMYIAHLSLHATGYLKLATAWYYIWQWSFLV